MKNRITILTTLEERVEMTDRINEAFDGKIPKLVEELSNRKSEFLPCLANVALKIKPVLSNIVGTFPNYTMHNINHSVSVMEYMYVLIDDVSLLSDLEIYIMILAALFHDSGMYLDKDSKSKIINGEETSDRIQIEAALAKYQDQHRALEEYVRRTHAERSRIMIKYCQGILCLPNMIMQNLSNDLYNICLSHNESVDWIKYNLPINHVKGNYSYNCQYIALLLRISDLLDIDETRTPKILLDTLDLSEINTLEWKQHLIISNSEKICVDKQMPFKKIVFHGESCDPIIYRKLLGYIEWINKELMESVMLAETMDKQYVLYLNPKVENRIETREFDFSNLTLRVDLRAITRILIGDKIGRERDFGLREIIQNSMDACRIMQEIRVKEQEPDADEYVPKITIYLNKAKDLVRIRDNGIGMSIEVLKKFYLNVGKSYYNTDDFELLGYTYQPRGNFELGFLACLMMSDTIVVKTRKYNEKITHEISIVKNSEYIMLKEIEDMAFTGTLITFQYSSFMNVFDNDIRSLSDFVGSYFLNESVVLELRNCPQIT